MDVQLYEDKILKKIGKLHGLSNSKNTILQYAKYVNLCKTGNIKGIGNSNIIIDCSDDYTDRKALINLLIEILNNEDAHYLTKRELINDIWFNRIESEVIILDTIELQSTLQFNIADLKYRVNRRQDKTFIVVSSEFNRKSLAYLTDNFSWYLEITSSSIDDKQGYIVNKLKENGIKVSKNSKFISDLALEELPVIDTTLLNLIIDCKLSDIAIIDETFVSKHSQTENTDELDINNKSNNKTALQQLDELIGLDDIKKQIHQIVNYVNVNKKRGKLPMLHMALLGNSGCGKNEVARLVGQIFKEEGILTEGQFVEVSRADLIAPYIGQTALKTQEVINRAKGGVLFIDEAYSLDPKDSSKDFGSECIATIIKAMEDNRDNLCVILAGYNDDMEQLLQSNKGFSSRIQFKLQFPDYTATELYQIFKKMVKDDCYKLSSNVKSVLVEHFEIAKQRDNFGNGRYVRSLFEKLKFEQADKCATDTTADVNTITKADVINVIEHLEKNMTKEKNRIGFMF